MIFCNVMFSLGMIEMLKHYYSHVIHCLFFTVSVIC